MAAKGAASPTSARRIAAAQRQVEALALRKMGHTFAVIADRLGYANEAGARHAVSAAIERSIREPAEDLRALIIARNEAFLKAIFKRAIAGDLDAIDRCIKLDHQIATVAGLYSKSVKVGQDPNAAPVGVNVNAKMAVNLYNLLKRLTPEERRLLNDLRQRLVGPAGGSGEPSANGVGEHPPAG